MFQDDGMGGGYGAGRYHNVANLIRKGCRIFPKKKVGRFRGWNSACALGALVAGMTGQKEFHGFISFLEDVPELDVLINIDEPSVTLDVYEACEVSPIRSKKEAVDRFVWRSWVLLNALLTADDVGKAWRMAYEVRLKPEYSRYVRLRDAVSLISDSTKYSREAIADWLCRIGGCLHEVRRLEEEVRQNRDKDSLSSMVARGLEHVPR